MGLIKMLIIHDTQIRRAESQPFDSFRGVAKVESALMQVQHMWIGDVNEMAFTGATFDVVMISEQIRSLPEAHDPIVNLIRFTGYNGRSPQILYYEPQEDAVNRKANEDTH